MLRRAALPIADYLDNEYTALIVSFTPKPAGAGLWTYEMELVVTRLTKLRGAPYPDARGG